MCPRRVYGWCLREGQAWDRSARLTPPLNLGALHPGAEEMGPEGLGQPLSSKAAPRSDSQSIFVTTAAPCWAGARLGCQPRESPAFLQSIFTKLADKKQTLGTLIRLIPLSPHR